ncbi:MAG: hypothetical protein JWN29_3871 [Acidimicrobiales bacterium]|jgi:hypothetical protein|nr:hypothetical protein [Acidimicrobiales bacterium]
MTDDIPFLDRLGDQLRHATPPPPARHTGLVLRVAAAVVVIAFGVIAFSAWRSEPVSAGVDVRRSGAHVVLRVFGTAPPASEIQEIAHRNGLNIDVTEVPVGPSLVGQMFPSTVVPPEVDFTGGITHGSRTISFPLNWKGRLGLLIGRPARGGEAYGQPSDALAPGEPLACQQGSTAEAVAAAAERQGVTVRWWLTDPDTFVTRRDVPFAEVRSSAYAGYRVAYGVAFDAHQAIAELTPDGREIPPKPIKKYRAC